MPEATKVRAHQWMQLVVTPVEVLEDAEGKPVIFIDPEKGEVAMHEARYGCFACNEGLEDNYGTNCAGA